MGDSVRHLMCAAAAILMVACSHTSSDKPQTRQEDTSKQVLGTTHFVRPNAPMMLPPNEAVQYMVKHWWDDLLSADRQQYLCDSTHVSGVPVQELEQAAADYVYLLSSMPLDMAQAHVEAFASTLAEFATKDASNVFTQLNAVLCRYMYDPNSPVRDEDIYGPYAAKMAECKIFDNAQCEKFVREASNCALNSRGSIAADFSFVTLEGRQYSLHKIKADYTILFFSNPGCNACKEIIQTLNSMPTVEGIKLAVVNVYIDEDVQAWKEYADIYPENWYNGFDHNGAVRSDELYDVRAIPSLYLLDKDKRVLLKDAPLDKLIKFGLWQQ